MEIFPAIDLLDGKVVRLYQGDYNKKEAFGDDPLKFACHFEQAGAKYLHVVDLDGAREGSQRNFPLVKAIAEQTGLFIELGGGIRDEKTVEKCFEAGIGRVILGTSALKDPAFTRKMVEKYGEAIAVGVDARDGKVAIEGWLETSDIDGFGFCKEMANIGVKYIIYTDISRDGASRGINHAIYKQLSTIKELSVTASGGVSSLEDIAQLRDLHLYAAILGKALYTGAIRLEEALFTAQK